MTHFGEKMCESVKSRCAKWSKRLLHGISLVGLMMSMTVQANERRVTTEIVLPIQQATSAQPESTASSPVAVTQAASVQPLPAQLAPASGVSASPVQTPPVQQTVVAVANTQPVVKPAAQAQPKPSAPTKPVAQQLKPKPAASQTPGPMVSIVPDFSKPLKSIPTLNTAQMHAPAATAVSGQAFVQEFESYIEHKVAPYVPGVAVAIISQGQLKSLRAFGVRTAGTRVMVTPDTVFRLASSSKPVAATAVAMYANRGGIAYDEKVVDVLPNVVFKQMNHGKNVTLKHLLGQSVGLPTHSNSSAIDIGIAYNEAVRRLRLVNFVCQPGKCYAYQNVTYSLAGDMVAQKAGRSFESVVEELLFAPLGMHSASFGRANYLASPNRAVPHVAQGQRWVPTDVTENWYRVAPAAGVNASAVDMARFVLAQLGRRPDVIAPKTLNELQSRVTRNTKEQSHYASREAVSNTAYGLGWRIFDYGRNKNFVHHGGWVKGFRSEIVFNRELGIGMVFLSNSESRLARDVIFKFMDMHEASQQAAKRGR